MKRALLLTICMMFAASLAFGQAGNIGVYADAGAASCDLNNAMSMFVAANVVHVNSPGATACQFAVEIVGTPLTLYGAMSSYNTIGDPFGGIAVAYGTCLISPIHALTLNLGGVSGVCDMIRIIPDPTPDVPGIYVTDCASPTPNLLTIATGGAAYLNNDGSCPCNVPTEETSWGQIKAIYQ